MDIISAIATYVVTVLLCLHSRPYVLRWRRQVREWLKWRVVFRLLNYSSYAYFFVRNSFGYLVFGVGAILLAWFVPNLSDKICDLIASGCTGGGLNIIPIAGLSMSGVAFCIGQIDRYLNRDTSFKDSFLGKNVTEVRYRMNNTSMVRSRLFRNSLVALITSTVCYVLLRNLSLGSQTLPFTAIRLLSLTSAVLLISFVIVFLSVTANVVASFNGYSREDAIDNIADTFARDGFICWSPVMRAAYAAASEHGPWYFEYSRSAQRMLKRLSSYKSRHEIAVILEVLDATCVRGRMQLEEEERLRRRLQKGQESIRQNKKCNDGEYESAPEEKDSSRSGHMLYYYASLMEASFHELVHSRENMIGAEWQNLLWELIRVFAVRLNGYYASICQVDKDVKNVCREGVSGSLWSTEIILASRARVRVSPTSRTEGKLDSVLPGWCAIAAVLEMEEHCRDMNLDYLIDDRALSVLTKLVCDIQHDSTKKKLANVFGCFILRHAEEIFADNTHDYAQGVKGLWCNIGIPDNDVAKYCEQELLSMRTHTSKYVNYLAQQAGSECSSFMLLRYLYYSRRSGLSYNFAMLEGFKRALQSSGSNGAIEHRGDLQADAAARMNLVTYITSKAQDPNYDISHYVSDWEIKWLVRALGRSLDLALVNEFVALRREHAIHELTVLDFLLWYCATSPHHVYYSEAPLVNQVETKLKKLESDVQTSQAAEGGIAGDTGLDYARDAREAIERALAELARCDERTRKEE